MRRAALLLAIMASALIAARGEATCAEVLEAKSNNATGLGGYVPQCDADGNFIEIQCNGGTGFCWCADTKTGESSGARDRRRRERVARGWEP